MLSAAFFLLMLSYPLASLALTQAEYDTTYDYLYDYWRTGDGRLDGFSWIVSFNRVKQPVKDHGWVNF